MANYLMAKAERWWIYSCLSLNPINVLKIIRCLDWKTISHFESVNKGILAPVKGASIEEVAIVEQQVSCFI